MKGKEEKVRIVRKLKHFTFEYEDPDPVGGCEFTLYSDYHRGVPTRMEKRAAKSFMFFIAEALGMKIIPKESQP